MLKKLLLSSILAGSIIPLSAIAMEEQALAKSQQQEPASLKPAAGPLGFVELAGYFYGAIAATAAIQFGAIVIHELGHKYAGKILAGVDGTIAFDRLGAYIYWPEESTNHFTPATLLLKSAAGPAAGLATGYSLKKISAKYPKGSYLQRLLSFNGYLTMIINAYQLIPRTLDDGSYTDGKKMLDAAKHLLSKQS